MENKEGDLQSLVRMKHYSHTSKIPLIIYCDPGIDDTAMLAQALTSPNFEILAIICSAGNTTVENTLRNALIICELAERTDVKVFSGALGPINSTTISKATLDGKHVYGEGGLGKKVLPPPKMKPAEGDAIDFAAHTIINSSHSITLVSTAGLTDVFNTLNKIVKTHPDSLKKIAGISMMGGVFDISSHANAPLEASNRWAEFNIIYDSQASNAFFKLCDSHKINIYLAPLDLTHNIRFSSKEIQLLKSLPQNPLISFVSDLLDDIPAWYLDKFGRDNPSQPAHDLNATMCLLHPELYEGKWVRVKCRNTDHQTPGFLSIKTRKVEMYRNVFVLNISPENVVKFFEFYAKDIAQLLHRTLSKSQKGDEHDTSCNSHPSAKKLF